MNPGWMRRATVSGIMSGCLFLAGCGGETSIKPLDEGYSEVDVTYRGMGEPQMTQHQLAYTDSQGRRTIIWPWVFSDIIISNHVAVFMGENPEHDQRLIAVNPPGLPLDITPQAIVSWASIAGLDVTNAVTKADLMDCKRSVDGDPELYVGLGDMNQSTNVNILVKWDQIPGLMREVATKGIERKDKKFGVTYLMTGAEKPVDNP